MAANLLQCIHLTPLSTRGHVYPYQLDELFLVLGGLVVTFIFSLPGRSPGRAIVLPLASASAAASALAKSLTLKFLCDGQGAVRRAILSL